MLAEYLIVPILSDIALIEADAATRGVAIAITGMLIVACALLLICLFITSLPKILAAVATVWPETEESHAAKPHAEKIASDEESLLAAIGFVLHHRLQQDQGNQASSPQKT
jgi:Na+-transporting methylmalonyl-CoA/oxaloacetate decarboxylase gamma subunit